MTLQKSKNTLSLIEKKYSKDIQHMLDVNSKTYPVNIDWNIIDNATSEYAEIVKEYDFSEIVKSMVSRYGRGKNIGVMPMAGNISITDSELGFASFYAFLEASRRSQTKTQFKTIKTQKKIMEHCEPIVRYLTDGKHSSKDMQFGGWKRTFTAAANKKKTAIIGVLSVDIPLEKKDKNGKYVYTSSGTQHYVSYFYELQKRALHVFDSASKNASKDMSEVYFLLKAAFEAMSEGEVRVYGVAVPYILQPGAGDRSDEDDRSYNNQNVFCHTWSLWFATLSVMFYDEKRDSGSLMAFFKAVAHKNDLLNLCMIKQFAQWLITFLHEDEAVEIQSLTRQQQKIIASGDSNRIQSILSDLYAKRNPLDGLKYIWSYKNEKPILIEDLCVARKVKVDVSYLDKEMDVYSLDEFYRLIKLKRCNLGYAVNAKTGRCVKRRTHS